MPPTTFSKPYHFELISARHDVAAFDCKATLLNAFLHTKALSETLQDKSRTFVLLDTSNVVAGYVTLRADALNYHSSETNHFVSTPVVELSYLARDTDRRGEGLGDILLIYALSRVAEAAERIGIAGISLAYTQEGKPLYERFGFGEHPYGRWLLFLPLGKVRAIVSELPTEYKGAETTIVNLADLEEEDDEDEV